MYQDFIKTILRRFMAAAVDTYVSWTIYLEKSKDKKAVCANIRQSIIPFTQVQPSIRSDRCILAARRKWKWK